MGNVAGSASARGAATALAHADEGDQLLSLLSPSHWIIYRKR